MITKFCYRCCMNDSDSPDDMLQIDTRVRIIAAAAKLIAEGGSEAVTTRAVAVAASVQAPTIYRLFGDKRGLLDAVSEEVFAAYVAGKAEREPSADPVEDLKQGWDTHIGFGLANPAVFVLTTTGYPEPLPRAAAAGMAVLRERVHRVARTGQLQVSEERAVTLIHAAGTGTVLALLEKAPDDRHDLAEAAWRMLSDAIIGPNKVSTDKNASAKATALRAHLDDMPMLTPGERLLLSELLQRISDVN